MKKLLITLSVAIYSIFSFASAPFSVRNYSNAFIFNERGIEFAVFPDGQFDFNILNRRGGVFSGNQIDVNVGFIGQGLFASRFIFQWIYSEKKGESAIPIGFWYLSIFGGLSLLTYAIFRKDPVIISGQLFGVLIYARNLYLIYNKN